MNVIRDLIPESKWSIKCPYVMVAEFFVMHNTSNDASAEDEVAYMKRNNAPTSFHYAVDDKEVRQGIPIDRNAFHAGDGVKGDGNRKGIGVEICYSKSGGVRFEKAEERAAEFVAEKLIEFGWGIDKVKKHQDFSGKYCPHRTLDIGWNRFL
jgi:N-acetylmuramoyl-L-alanine amidase CwlA